VVAEGPGPVVVVVLEKVVVVLERVVVVPVQAPWPP